MKITTLVSSLLLAAASALPAVVLYDSQPVGSNVVYNRYSEASPNLRHFSLARVELTESWQIDSIQVYNSSSANYTTYDAHVHIVPDSALAIFDPTGTGDVMAATGTYTAGNFFTPGLLVTSVSTDMILAPGVYWIGVTPIVDNVSALAAIQFARRGSDPSSSTATYAVGPSAVTGTSTSPSTLNTWETRADTMALTINGSVVPEPSAFLLSGLGALALFCRRRA